jgi:hypothetical protein
MKPVFADTSYYVAFLSEDDERHSELGGRDTPLLPNQ